MSKFEEVLPIDNIKGGLFLIKLVNVNKSYKNKKILKKVNLEINESGLYSFIGENGCGKTTLLNIITKLIKPSKGKVINKFNDYTFISQKVNLINHLTIKEHFYMFGIDVNLLKRMHLFNKLDSYPSKLSHGQKQRIACLLAIHSPQLLLIADEPTSHLDKKNANLIFKEIVKISKNKTVLLVSHDLESVNNLSNEIYKIENKQVNLIENKKEGKKITINKRPKYKFSKYTKKSLKYYKKINFLFSLIFFVIFFLLLFGSMLRSNINEVLSKSIDNSLDYNKFYLKQCDDLKRDNVILKKCYNLEEEKIELINESEHKLGYNYDMLMNSLYETDKFNVINVENISLKEGRYPQRYNEIIASSYSLNEDITLSSSTVIGMEKTDIYNKSLTLKVVGIVDDTMLLKKDSYYLDYDLLEDYLKNEKLINNKKTLYDYFSLNDLNDYKYVLYFTEIDTNFLQSNDIEYLSASYEYFESIDLISNKLNECLIYLNIVMISFCTYYLIRLIKKKINHKSDEILFLKSMGLKNKKIIKLINKEQKFLIVKAYMRSCLMLIIIFYLIFKNITFNIFYSFIVLFITMYINKKIIKRVIKKRVRV